MPAALKFTLKSIAILVGLLVTIFSTISATARVSYKAGTQADLVTTEITRVETEIDKTNTEVATIRLEFKAYEAEDKTRHRTTTEALQAVVTELAVQTAILGRIEEKYIHTHPE